MKNQNTKVSAALGTFDGLHLGHTEVLKSALNIGERSVCIGFAEPPKAGEEMLMQPRLKERLLYEMGFDEVVLLRFNEVKNLSYSEFLSELTTRYGITRFCCGYNYRFGKNALGNTAVLSDYCRQNGLEIKVHEPVVFNDTPVSSTQIRGLLKAGDLQKASLLLGRCFEIEAPVLHGEKRGRTMGFPTVNQPIPSGSVRLPFGVYETEIVHNGKPRLAMTNYGIRPTYRLNTPICETHIIGFAGDVYGQTLSIRFKRFIREERKFSSLSELQKQLSCDLENIKNKNING